MRRFITAITALVVLATAAPAAADRADCGRSLEASYSSSYKKVKRAHGKRAPGRNIRRQGVLFRGVVFDATCGELRRSRGQLKRLMRTPRYPQSFVTTAEPPAQPPAGVQSPSVAGAHGGWAIPEYIVMCESGGDYNARNPSGAYGAYQIMPGTAAAFGCDLSTPGGQDQCAARIYAAQGASPWVCG